ncbi:hypothetical protein LCGC14_1313310 [marine sediment metagenome]|uniref:Uncharacterized protein n=1 Tax=marine sediment metagenome TaxID=412755 RepID=A0A0F9KLL1_9ZZZZ
MAIDVQKALRRATDVARFLPTPQDLLRPFPRPKQGELVTAGIAADLLSFGVGFIPYVGDIVGDFIEDNIIADVETRLTPEERTEFREQNRVYPNGIALVRTFQRTQVAPGGGR